MGMADNTSSLHGNGGYGHKFHLLQSISLDDFVLLLFAKESLRCLLLHEPKVQNRLRIDSIYDYPYAYLCLL